MTTMSWFNMQIICMDCNDREHAHPDIQRAKQAEERAMLAGDKAFPGIGLPADLS